MANARFWAMSLGFSAALAVGLTFVALGNSNAASVLTVFAITITYALAIGVPATLVVPPAMKAVRRARPGYQLLVAVLAESLVAVPGTLLGTSVLVLVGLVPAAEFWTRWQADVRISLFFAIAVAVVAVMFGRLHGRLQQTKLALQSQELARERAEKLASEARLASLTSSLQPHFLFNTLNSISSLIRTDPLRAERLLGRFAALLRSSLDARGGELVTLRKEMKLVADYLEIQHVRFGHRLRYELELPVALLEARVPPFSLQTLVENSVKYAVAPSTRGSVIRCFASTRGTQLCLEVWDDGPGFSVEQIRPQHGIDNLRERLRSIYGSAARLIIEREGSCTRVALELPIHAEAAA